MVINDEVSKEIKGNVDILAINIYRFNDMTIPLDQELNEDELILKIATELKTRYKFFKVAQKDNKTADIFMAETTIANVNAMTIVDPSDLMPTETIQIQIEIGKILEEEGFNEKGESTIEEFGGESSEGVEMLDVLDNSGITGNVIAHIETIEKTIKIEEVPEFEIPATLEEAEAILAEDLAKALNLPQ